MYYQNNSNRNSYGRDSKNYGNSGNSSNYQQSASLPDRYLKGGYYLDAEKEKLRKEYIIDYPRQIADGLSSDGGKDANKRTQMRKYYEYTLRVRDELKLKNGDFEYVCADLERLLPYVEYAKSRGVVSQLFVKFIEENLKSINDAKDFRAFVKHFEAIIAFMKKD